MTPEEYRAATAAAMSEAQLQAAIIGTGASRPGLAQRLGWMAYHTHDSRRSVAGYPDLTLVHPEGGRLVFAELKRQKRSYPTPDQRNWLDALGAVALDVNGYHPHREAIAVHLWRPLDLLDGTIEKVLRRVG